jgi:uncharacterized protein YcnI
MRCFAQLVAFATALGIATSVQAHITLETQTAPAASSYKAVLRVGHGCEGSPTTSVRVQIPEGVIAVTPMPKPGWEVATVIGDYEKPYAYYDETLTKGVKEIAWTGGRLLDEHYDEFVFRAFLPDAPPGTVVYFPLVQECETGVHRWIEIPGSGKTADDYEEPAPSVTLTEKEEE